MKIHALAALFALLAVPTGLAQERGRTDTGAGPAAQRRAAPVARPAPSAGQEAAPAASPTGHNLARVRSAFAGFDVNGDGVVERAEALRQGVTGALFTSFDENGDGKVTLDEFVLAYRAKLAREGQVPAADLEAESTRIRAARRAQAADQGRAGAERVRREAPGAQRPATRPEPQRQPPVRPAPVRPAPPRERPAPAPARPAPDRPSRG